MVSVRLIQHRKGEKIKVLASWIFEGGHFKKRRKNESCSVVFGSLRTHGLYSPWNSSSQNTGVGNLFLLQQIFLTKELNQALLHCRWILYQLSYQVSPINGESLKARNFLETSSGSLHLKQSE